MYKERKKDNEGENIILYDISLFNYTLYINLCKNESKS